MADKRLTVSLVGEGARMLRLAREQWGGGDDGLSSAEVVKMALKEKLRGSKASDRVLRTMMLYMRVVADDLNVERDLIWMLEWFNSTLQLALSPRISASVVREILTRADEEIRSRAEPLPDFDDEEDG